MLGGGFPPTSIDRGIELGAGLIAVDGGSTDSGPHYLGTGTPKTARAAVARDLSAILPAAHRAGIPVVVGSCGTSGTDSGVDWVGDIAAEVARDAGISLQVALIYSELDPTALEAGLDAQRIRPLEPAGPLDHATLRRCSHIVGLMGHEPIATALDRGADLAGLHSPTVKQSAGSSVCRQRRSRSSFSAISKPSRFHFPDLWFKARSGTRTFTGVSNSCLYWNCRCLSLRELAGDPMGT